jgi:hypothetical protein
MKELTIRFDFQPKSTAEARKIASIHYHLLAKMKKVLAAEIEIYNNKGIIIETIDTITWKAVMHQRHFCIHASKQTERCKTSKYSIIHHIHTSHSLSTIRSKSAIHRLLQEHSCYLKSHAWEETEWDTVQAGYLIGINPQHYTPDVANDFVAQMLKMKKSKGQCPPLPMIYSSPHITLDDHMISTKAYAIEYRCKDGSKVIRKLKAFCDTNYFLMAKLHCTHPKAFANAIKIQTKSMKETYVLPMVNVTPLEIFYLQPALEEITGVKTVIQTRKTHTYGRYNILIDAKTFKVTKGIIQARFAAIYKKHVPINAKQDPEALQFYGPPEIPMDNDYEESSGEKSFISMSAASFASFDMSNTHDNYEMFIPVAGTFSWSDAVQEKTRPIPHEVTTPGPDATATAESTEISAMTPRETQYAEEIRSLRVELPRNSELKSRATRATTKDRHRDG